MVNAFGSFGQVGTRVELYWCWAGIPTTLHHSFLIGSKAWAQDGVFLGGQDLR